MITLPPLTGIPPVLAPMRADSLAARYALAMSPAGPIARPAATKKHSLEHAVLMREVEAWLDKAAAPLEIFRPRVHLTMGVPPVSCECRERAAAPITLWLANQSGDNWDSRWTLERRWREIERTRKGLAQTALAVLHASTWQGVPVFTPQMALGMAQFTWWYGEEDERHVLEEWHNVEEPDADPEQDHGVPRRTWFDKLLPREATGARKLVRDSTLRWSGELGRLILDLAAASRSAKRRRSRFALHTQQDDLNCVGFGATLRWSTRDPMPRVFDDHANGLYESNMVEEAWGWLVCGEPKELPLLLAEIGQRFALARLQEKLIAAIAERTRE